MGRNKRGHLKPFFVITKRDTGKLIRSAYLGKMAFVKRMLERGVDPNILHENSGSRPLAAAAADGHKPIVAVLLKAGADPNAQDTWKGMPPNGTPLEGACEKGHLEVVKLLVKHGADVNKGGYWPPLKLAASNGRGAVVKYLIGRGAKIEPAYMYLAARSGDADTIRELLRAGLNPNWRNNSGDTPLHLAAVKENPESARLLISAGARLNVQNKRFKETPLHWAAQMGRLTSVQRLVEAGASISLRNHKGKTAEQWARAFSRDDVAQFLKECRRQKS